MNSRLRTMIDKGIIPARGGVWIDCYNQTVSDIAGTIMAGIDYRNHYFVTDMEIINTDKEGNASCITKQYGWMSEKKMLNPDRDRVTLVVEPQVLGWSRDHKDNIINRHPVDVANVVTSGKRKNTQNYVVEAINEYEQGISRTIKAHYQQTSAANLKRSDSFAATGVIVGIRIRKFTPRECFRLMDVPDSYIDKIQKSGICRTEQYKMAGNSIVVNCLYLIFRNLFYPETEPQTTLF